MYLGVKFLFVLTPSPCGHSPYILLRKTQGGEGEVYISLSPRLRCYSKRLAMLRGMVGGRGLKSTFNILNSSIAVPRSITGCGVSYIGEVSQSDGGVENAIVSVFILDIPLSSLTCPIALRRTVLAI